MQTKKKYLIRMSALLLAMLGVGLFTIYLQLAFITKNLIFIPVAGIVVYATFKGIDFMENLEKRPIHSPSLKAGVSLGEA